MKTNLFIAAASGALLLSTAAAAQVQQNDTFGQLLAAVFGTNQQASEQQLDADWNQGRRPFEQRRPQLEARIDAGVRDGSLGRGEADQMRREYDDIVRLEAQYTAGGDMSDQERGDLRARYRALSQRVGGDNHQAGNQGDYRWQSVASRDREFQQRIDAGLRNRSLSQYEATRLRADWRSLAQVEAGYQRGGIDQTEQADLWARYNAIDSRIGDGRAGGNSGFGSDRNTARWSQMESRLTAAERSGTINRASAVQVRSQLGDLARLDVAYSARGYSNDERSYLMRRYAEIDAAMGYRRR